MKIDRIISKMEALLSADHHKLKVKIKSLKHVLKKLRKREKKLQTRFEEKRGDNEKMSRELALIHAQRKKGVDLLKTLKTERKANKKSKAAQ